MDSIIHMKSYFIAQVLETEIFVTESLQIPPQLRLQGEQTIYFEPFFQTSSNPNDN